MVIKSPPSGYARKNQVKKPVSRKTPVTNSVSPEIKNVQKILDAHTKHLVQIDETLSSLKNDIKGIKDILVANKSTKPSPVVTSGRQEISWHGLIDPNREYSQKEIVGITKISQPTLSMAKVRGHIVTRSPPGVRGWVVKGSDLLAWDKGRTINTGKKAVKPAGATAKKVPEKSSKTVKEQGTPKKSSVALTADVQKGKKPLVVQKKETKGLTVQSSTTTTKPTSGAKKPVKTPLKATTAKPVVKKTVPAPIKGIGAKKTVDTRKTSGDQVSIPDDIPDRITDLKKVVTQTQFGHDVGLPQKVIYEITTRKQNFINPAILAKITTVLKKYES